MSMLEQPLYHLLQSEPFYANFLLGAKIRFDVPEVKTAGATVRNGQIEFVFNTDFYSKLSLQAQKNILKHEILHVLLDHCGNRGKAYGNLNNQIKNIAMDCAINQHLGELGIEGVTLEGVEKQLKRKLNPNDTWEYYYEAIADHCEKNGKIKYVVDHSFMDEGKETTEAEKAINKAAIKDALDKAVKASAGKVPTNIQSLMSAYNTVAKLPWKQLLRNFVANARHTTTLPTRKRPNRRFKLDQPGRKKDKKLILGVCTDSSASVSDADYASFMNEINTLAKSTTITYLVHADCEVQKIDIIKGGKAKGDVLTTRHGGGGTAYQPAIDACTKLKCDAIIYFGDFDTADTPINPGISFLWVGVGDSPAPADFGRVVRL